MTTSLMYTVRHGQATSQTMFDAGWRYIYIPGIGMAYVNISRMEWCQWMHISEKSRKALANKKAAALSAA